MNPLFSEVILISNKSESPIGLIVIGGTSAPACCDIGQKWL